MDKHLKYGLLMGLYSSVLLTMPTTVLANSDTQNATDLPQIVSWEDGHGYLESGEMFRDGWGYDTVNPAGKYVLFSEDGTVLRRSEAMEAEVEEAYTGTELVPSILALRAQVFDGFAGTIEVVLEEQSGVIKTVTLNSENFYEWNLSAGSGTYRIQSVSATEGEQSFVTEFSNVYQNLPEEGLLVMPITVTKDVIESIPEPEKSQEEQAKEGTEQERNTSMKQNRGNKTSDSLEHQNQEENIVDKVKANNLAAIWEVVMAGVVIIGGLIWYKKK